MSKTILLIENDAPFAEEISGGLEAMGYLVRVVGDGKDGLDLAKDLNPDAIVLCVELPKLSGYSICNKLKKDDALKAIPLVLTSSEATEEVFEDHKKLKVRAEAYLIKPYVSAALVEKLAALIGMPEAGAAVAPVARAVELDLDGGDEEVVSLEEELALESFAGEPGQELPALDPRLPPGRAGRGRDGRRSRRRPEAPRRRLRRPLGTSRGPASTPFGPGSGASGGRHGRGCQDRR